MPHSVLAGAYSDCVTLVKKAYCDYTVHQARRNARHCRELMRAYAEVALAQSLSEHVDIISLAALAKKYTSHRWPILLS